MSFGNAFKVFSGVQEALILALMLVFIVAVFYIDLDITYKIGIAVLVFSLIMLSGLATAYMQAQKESRKAQA